MELQDELQVPRIANRVCDATEGGRITPIGQRWRKARRVGEVEELRAEIEVLRFRQVELLAQAEIPVLESGRAQNPHACRAKSPLSRQTEGGGVHPAIECWVLQCRIAVKIRTGRPASALQRLIRRCDRDR